MSQEPPTGGQEHTTSRRRVLGVIGAGTLAGTGLASTGLAAGAPSSDGRPGRYMVGLDASAGFAVARTRADTTYHELDFGAIGKLLAGRFPEPALAALRNNPNVRYVEPDVPARPDVDSAATSDDTVSTQASQTVPYGISQINADDTIAAGHTGAGVDVAILDSGIDPDHEDLASNLGSGTAIVDCSTSCGCHDCDEERLCPTYGDCETHYDDRDGHGTHVAGTVAAADNATGVVGVAPDATVHMYKIGDCTGCAFTSDMAAGFVAAADDGTDVLNLSYSSSDTQGLRDAVDYADSKGVVMVTNAGNEGCSDCIRAPGIYPEVLAVTAVDDGENPYSENSTGPEVDFTAPGVFVDSTVPNDGYAFFTGTSMASPHVVGALAVLMGGPYSAPEAVEELRQAATDVGLSANQQGHGMVDLEGTFEPTVETDAAFPGTSLTTLRGDLVVLGDVDSAECYFEYKRSSSSIYSDSASVTRTSPGLYDVSIATTTDTTYDFRAVAEFSDGSVRRGDVLTFRTPTGGGGGTE